MIPIRNSFFILLFIFPLSLFAKDFDTRLLQASAQAYNADTGTALNTIESYLSERPEDPNALFVKASVLDWKATLNWEEKSSQNDILALYKKANTLAFSQWSKDPENVDKLIQLGNSYLFLARKYSDLGKNFDAVLTGKKCQKHLEKALKLDPSRVDGLLALGGFHYLSDQIPPWLKPFRALLGIKGNKHLGLSEIKQALSSKHPFYYDTLYALMNVYLNFEKQPEKALEYWGVLEKIFPLNPELKLFRGKILEKISKTESSNAFLDLGKFCENNLKSCHSEYAFLGYFHAARLANDTGEKQKAQNLWAKSLEFESRFNPALKAEASYWSANIDLDEGRKEAALLKMNEALRVSGIPKKLREEIKDKIKKYEP